MSSVYCDASVLVALVMRDEQEPALRRWLGQEGIELAYSDFGWGELVSAVGQRVRRRHPLRPALGRRMINRGKVVVRRLSRLDTEPADIAEATAIMEDFTLGLRLPDAIHLATARRIGATLLTTDRAQGDAASALGIAYADPSRPDLKEPR